MSIGGTMTAYRASIGFGVHSPELIGAMTPTSINASGAVVGYRNDARTVARR